MLKKTKLATALTGLACLLLVSTLQGRSPVADAASIGDIETVRQLLREGADVNAPQGDGMTGLHWAAHRGDAPLAEILIYAGAKLESGTRIGHYTPLHIACRRAHAEVVKLLLRQGADPNAATTNSGATPLHLAAASGDPEIISALLAAGAKVEAEESSWGQTPLVFAAAKGRAAAIRVLLEAGADPARTTRVVDTAEMEEADKAAESRIAEILADFKEKEGGGLEWQPTPSQVQAAIEASREIQRKWPNVPKPGEEKERGGGHGQKSPDDKPSGKAAQKKQVAERKSARPTESETASQEEPAPAVPDDAKVLKFDAEGNPIYETPKTESENQQKPLTYGQLVGHWGGLTPLLHAVRQGQTEAVMALLEGGADINQTSAGDHTSPLLMAAVNGQFDLALLLLQQGANPNLASDAGCTPLFAVLERTWASKASYSHPMEQQYQKASYLEVMKALLEAGADPNVRLKEHLWYMEYTFSVLRSAGVDAKGATPFWRAALALDVDAMRLLKQYGADPGIPTIKPPQRRRRRPPAEEEPKKQAPQAGEASSDKKADEKSDSAEKAKVKTEEEDSQGEADEKEDPSGVPPVPVGGPAIYPIHAASGVGYGQAFAANAHRHVPDNWLNAVKFLVEECGADVNQRDFNAYTPLHHAASRGDNELILYLVSKGADVTAVSRKGQTTADMANGPIQRVSPYPDTVALLEKLGSKNNHKCVSC